MPARFFLILNNSISFHQYLGIASAAHGTVLIRVVMPASSRHRSRQDGGGTP